MSNIDKIIDKTHFKTFDKVRDHVRRELPEVTDDEIKDVIAERVKDRKPAQKVVKKYYNKIFSRVPNTWFHDLFDNTKDGSPRFFHLFIGVNTRYGVAIPIQNKSGNAVLKSLREFVDEFKPVKLTSDQEAAFSDKNVLEFLKENNVRVQFVKDNNHSTLGIIDRFTRTLRDLNTPSEKSKSQSHAEKYRVFTTARMQKLLGIYNNTYHNGIKCTPKQMFENPELEEEYIFDCIEKQEEQARKVKDL
jgi:hypothetical protein